MIYFHLASLIVLIVLVPSRLSEFNPSLNLVYSFVYFINLTCFFATRARYEKNWLRFDVLFLIGFTIVHLQIPTLYALGVEPRHPDLVWINKQVVNYATWLSAVAIIFWMIGGSLLKFKSYNASTDSSNMKVNKNFWLIDSLLVISCFGFLLTAGATLFSGTYNGTVGWGGGAHYVFLVFHTLLYLRIIYFFSGVNKNESIRSIFLRLIRTPIFTSILSVFILIFLLIGDRGPVLKVFLFFFGAYAIFVKPISFARLVSLLAIGAFIFTILVMGRGKDNSSFNNQNIFERGFNNFAETKDLNLTDELASSNRVLYMALDMVPEKHPYLYGVTYVLNMTSAVPFMTGITVELFEIPKMYRGTSSFFTIMSLGPNATWGVGSEVIADIYVNFGVYGVFLLMFLFGLFSRKVYINSLDQNLTYVIISLCLLSEALSINRGMLLYPLGPIVYLLVAHYSLNGFRKKS